MTTKPPRIDGRTFSNLLEELQGIIPHYTPEWKGSDEKDPGVALLKIFSHMTESVIHRFNQVPHKNFVAFLDMLGIELIPAQPSRVPLTFTLAKGTDDEILIPARTQASCKTVENEELLFETEKKLLTTPSQLKRVISIDPKKDAIYLPPPGFLDTDSQKPGQLSYELISTALSGDKDFQLNHAADLKEKDILKINDGKNMEYVIVSSISSETIVNVKGKLLHSHLAEIPVQKMSKFNLFEGKNMQKHILFLGHSDFFNIKGTVTFTLNITIQKESLIDANPLKMLWEYWGELKGEEGEDWRKFETLDKTRGFSQDGEIELAKTIEGEIKEKEINDIKNRWIRCIVDEPLPPHVSRNLPKLYSINFKIKSSKENLLPDQAFNNDVPLDITKPFFPFGQEPKIFDNFFVASKEGFSKKGGKIILDMDIEPIGMQIGAPTAILFYYNYENEKILVFFRGTRGGLVELIINPDGTGEEWEKHGSLNKKTFIASGTTPSTVSDSFISVFARTENGHLVERFYDGEQWEWKDQGVPNGITINFDPAAVYGKILGFKTISAFVTGSDGCIYEFNHSPNNLAGKWINHGKPDNNISIILSPYAQSYVNPGYDIRFKVFVIGNNGQLYELDCKAGDDSKDEWTDYGSPTSSVKSVKLDSRPFAVIYSIYDPQKESNAHYAKVFVKGSDGNLWKYNTIERITTWINLKKPPDGTSIESDPHGHLIAPSCEENCYEGKHIFIRGSDNDLWELLTIAYENRWISHYSPRNAKLHFSPFLILDKSDQEHIFSASDKYSSIRRRIGLDDTKKIWNEYKDSTDTPTLSWEYWNKNGWIRLKVDKDETVNFLKGGKIMFDLPEDLEKTEIAGQKNYWIKARIIAGGYGKETLIFNTNDIKSDHKSSIENDNNVSKQIPKQELIIIKDSIKPPIIKKLTISYELLTSKYPKKCITYNNLEYLDQTDANRLKNKLFQPFIQLEEKYKTLYIGFKNAFKGDPIRIFFAAVELKYEKKPKLKWKYSKKNDWEELDCRDATEGLIIADVLELIGPSDFSAFPRFGNSLFWIKGSFIEGDYDEYPLLEGIYPNTTWALQAETIKDETFGSSDGESNQIFSFLKFPVLEGEIVRVHEHLSEEEKEDIRRSIGHDAVLEEKDETGNVSETWIEWSKVPDFFDSGTGDRHYTLDSATGHIQFGDGTYGMIPPSGDNNIKAFWYQTGGGKQGNVQAREIKTLTTAVAGVDRVINHVAADGGADTTTLDQMLEIGPAVISHRNRAVTAEDFEWLALQASRTLARVKCLPNTSNRKTPNYKREREPGWVTVIIIPDSPDDKPLPSLELKRKVKKYLESRCTNILSSAHHVHVASPSYVEISVSVDVFVTSIDVASEVEREIDQKLKAFFHPLTGGSEEEGWDFGRDVSASDIYAFLEDIKGVDHVENLTFIRDDGSYPDVVKIKPEFLAANGNHLITIQLWKGG